MKPSLLEGTNMGRALRHEREARDGRWQGPLTVPAGSVVLGVALDSANDELATELLVRILRAHGVDARSVLISDLENPPPPGSSPSSVSSCFLVSTRFDDSRTVFQHAVAVIGERFPQSVLVTLFFPSVVRKSPPEEGFPAAGTAPRSAATIARAAHSYVQAVQISLEIQTGTAGKS
jgi:hypothetical protein